MGKLAWGGGGGCQILTLVLGLVNLALAINSALSSPSRAAKTCSRIRGKYPFTPRQPPTDSYNAQGTVKDSRPACSGTV